MIQDVRPRDIIVFGAMLAQPRQSGPDWDATCRRLLAVYLAGLGSVPERPDRRPGTSAQS